MILREGEKCFLILESNFLPIFSADAAIESAFWSHTYHSSLARFSVFFLLSIAIPLLTRDASLPSGTLSIREFFSPSLDISCIYIYITFSIFHPLCCRANELFVAGFIANGIPPGYFAQIYITYMRLTVNV